MGPRMRRQMLVGLVVAVVVGSLGLSGCAPRSAVLVIGDSLTIGAVNAGVGTDHPSVWTIDAEKGRGTNAGVQAAQQYDIGSFDLVVVALGTNDFLDSAATYRVRIDRMMEVLGPSVPVVWINVDRGTDKLAPAGQGVNPALRAAAEAHPNLQVADWDGFIAEQDPALRATDQIHYVPAGYQVRARWMEALVPTQRRSVPWGTTRR